MKNIVHVAIAVFAIIRLLCWCPAVIAGSEDREPPAEITLDALADLYEPVVFDHATHMESFGCSSCHHHTVGDAPVNQSCMPCHAHAEAVGQVACGACHKREWSDRATDAPKTPAPPVYHIDIPRLKGALHLLCLDCHRSQSGPTGCRECHPFTAAGRTRFAAPEPNRVGQSDTDGQADNR